MDQRKVNMLAREYCDSAEPKIKFKPVVVSHREFNKCARPIFVPWFIAVDEDTKFFQSSI